MQLKWFLCAFHPGRRYWKTLQLSVEHNHLQEAGHCIVGLLELTQGALHKPCKTTLPVASLLVVSLFLLSDGNGADEDAVLQHDAQHQEHEVQCEHGQAQLPAHLPAAGGDGDDDEEKHEEEQHDGAEQPVGADADRLAVVKQSVDEPRDGQTETTVNLCELLPAASFQPTRGERKPQKYNRFSFYFVLLLKSKTYLPPLQSWRQ